MITAKKRFGQNFLTDPHKAIKLVEALAIQPGEIVLEVGPGTGILTELILKKGARLLAVELDRDLIESLNARFGANENFTLIQSDIIKLNPRNFTQEKFKVIGNLPYNISGAMIEWLIDYHDLLRRAVITVQKEVGNRLRAHCGIRDYGSLTVMAQSFFDIKRLFDIPPGCFSPKPKVFSTALFLAPHPKLSNSIDFASFRDFVRACFAQKRKKLINSLTSLGGMSKMNIEKEQIEKYLVTMGKKSDIRAEQLTLDEFVWFFKLVMEVIDI